MPKRDLYKVLGVPSGAPPSEIKRAYRRIAFTAHPDVGEHPDAERFRQAHEAYEVLSDPERRRSYEAEFEKQRRVWAGDRSGETGPAWIDDEFPASSPFLDAEYDTPWAFFSQRIGRSRRPRRITAEAVLTPREAESGCRVSFSLPCLVLCGRCGGCGEWWGSWCNDCNGQGVVEISRELLLELPAGSADGERCEVDLRAAAGISNLVLEVRISVSLERCDRRAFFESSMKTLKCEYVYLNKYQNFVEVVEPVPVSIAKLQQIPIALGTRLFCHHCNSRSDTFGS
ncbi:MAG: J domain-containing protein [Acidobacteria bacterium]|nr:J domain-containing protein [Acidobacteriota bacterium]